MGAFNANKQKVAPIHIGATLLKPIAVEAPQSMVRRSQDH